MNGGVHVRDRNSTVIVPVIVIAVVVLLLVFAAGGLAHVLWRIAALGWRLAG